MVMRYLTLFTLALLSLQSFANDTGEKRYLEVITSENPMFESAITVPGVREMYSECYKIEAANATFNGSNIGTCLWNKIQADETTLKKIEDLVAKQSGKEGSGRYRTTIETAKHSSKGLDSLKEFFRKKLEEALYGEYNRKKGQYEKLASQGTFFELYRTQLGKNIISAISSYCIEAEPVKFGQRFPIISNVETDREAARDESLKTLSQVNTSDNKLTAYTRWSYCIQEVSTLCTAGTVGGKHVKFNIDPNIAAKSVTYNDILYSCDGTTPKKKADPNKTKECESAISYSNVRACSVVQYIELARQSIGKTDAIAAKLNDLKGTKTFDNVKMYNSSENKDQSIDALTTISSGDALEALAAGQKAETEEMEECYKDGAIVDAEACKKYLSSDREEQYALLGELKIQEEVTYKKLDELENKPEEIAKLLKEEGYTEDEAEQLSQIAGVKEQITERYKAKKEAILKSLSEEIAKRTTKGEEFDAIDDLESIKAISDKTKKRAENFSKLVHYNNIVSAFLEVRGSDGGEETQRNTRALATEMKNSIISQENREKYEELGVDLNNLGYSDEQLNERFATTGMDYSESTNDDATLGIADINYSLIGLFTDGNSEDSED